MTGQKGYIYDRRLNALSHTSSIDCCQLIKEKLTAPIRCVFFILCLNALA